MVKELLNLTLRCDAYAPAIVRAAVGRVPDLGFIGGDAMLVASELVTNAVRHSLCAEDDLLVVRVTRDGTLRLSVLDPGRSGREARIAERPFELGGMGLKVVEEVVSGWGAERREDGYMVWADLKVLA